MNILITGAYGFIGTNLSDYLREHHTLLALDVLKQESDVYSHYYSWNDLNILPWDNLDVVIHLAGKAHDIKNKNGDHIYFDINTDLTKKTFDYFLQSKAKQFIFFSSVKAVADIVEGDCLTEDAAPKPIGAYGESKRKAEEYMQSKKWNEKNVYIFRPCMIHGPGNKGNLNLLYRLVNTGLPYPLGSFENKRSFLNIQNLSYIVEQFITQKPESGIYHLADDKPISTNKLIELIAKTANKKARIWKINRSFITAMAKIGTFCKLPFNAQQLQKLTENYVVSNRKMKSAIGIEQLPINVEDGLLHTLNSFQNTTKQ
ncbi:MAG: NAD-dependent epimerase/dehydratase family protein [Bacteroidales bacterium]|nr:NAD-dependent epimerase/dehydratase family protein [Bacteroidales bacterium]